MISEIQYTTISTADLDRSLSLFRDVMGMEIVAEQFVFGPEFEQLWGLPTFMTARSIILGKPRVASGRIRLIRFEPLSEIVICEGADPWDTGAVKTIDFVVTDFERAKHLLDSHGWGWRTDPQRYPLPNGEGELLEGHIDGPDDTTLGILQLFGVSRSAYVEVGDDVLFSEMATSSRFVTDIEQALSFYVDVLGFQVVTDIIIDQTKLQGLIESPSGGALRMILLGSLETKSGEIGLLKYEGIKGKSLAHRAKPPCRGVIMMSFETQDLDQLHDQLREHGVTVFSSPVQLELEPYGLVQVMTVQSPDGVMHEFFQRE